MKKLFLATGSLKQYLRAVLDPERLRTPVEARDALQESQSLMYRHWREHLDDMSKDDSLARDFFDLFPFVQFLYTTCQDKVRVQGGPIASLPIDLTIGEIKETAEKLKSDLASLETPQAVFGLTSDYQLLKAVRHLAESLEPLCEQYLDCQIEGQWTQWKKEKESSPAD